MVSVRRTTARPHNQTQNSFSHFFHDRYRCVVGPLLHVACLSRLMKSPLNTSHCEASFSCEKFFSFSAKLWTRESELIFNYRTTTSKGFIGDNKKSTATPFPCRENAQNAISVLSGSCLGTLGRVRSSSRRREVAFCCSFNYRLSFSLFGCLILERGGEDGKKGAEGRVKSQSPDVKWA